MRLIQGLNISYKLQEIIKECVQKAQENPFENYYFLAEETSVIEQIFFQYTHYLVNIEIMTWKQFLKHLIIENHLTHHHVITNTELVYQLRHILNEEDFFCFNNHQPYPLIDKLIPLMKDYNINHTYYHLNDCDSPKLKDFMHLYQSLENSLDDYTHLSIEDIIEECDFEGPKKHIYIDADHLCAQKHQHIIQQLDQYHDLTLLYTYQNDQRLLNLPYHHLCQNALTVDHPNLITDALFMQGYQSDQKEKASTFVSSTPYQEVKKVVYTIAQRIIEEQWHYDDFMIVYPDSSYLNILKETLDAAHLLHDIPLVSACQYETSYQKILSKLSGDEKTSFHEIAIMFQQEELESQYIEYFHALEEKYDDITLQEFQQFFQATYTFNQKEVLKNQDHITVCSIEQLRLAKAKHIYILGMNETIFPRTIKDTSLLLDEDIELLRKQHISTPLTTTEQLGIHYNDIMKAFLQPHLSITFSYSLQTLSGETLLPSSLYKQLHQIFELDPLKDPNYLSDDDYYLTGGILLNKTTLNTYIHDYLETKNQPNSLSIDLVKKLYSPILSVSQIETYNKCPFLYFIQYGLGIYPLSENKLMPNELGNIVHYVLSINVDHDKDTDQLVDYYIAKNESLSQKISSSYINQYFIQQLKKNIQVTLTVLKRQLNISEFQIFAKEKQFNDDLMGLPFKGFVDRIDFYDNKVAIIDYKSSFKDIDLNLAMQGFNIQMLVYLQMITKIYQKEPAAVLYFNTKKRILTSDKAVNEPVDENDFYKQYRFGGYVIDDESHQNIKALDPSFDKRSDIINVTYVKSKNEYKGHLLTLEQFHHLFEEIEKHIYHLYTQMMNGDIAIMPKGSDQKNTHTLVNPCRYCPNHSICSFDVFYNDYKLVEFLDVEKKLGGDDNAI